MVADEKRIKRVRATHDWFWFYFCLNEKVVRIFLSQSFSIASALYQEKCKRELLGHSKNSTTLITVPPDRSFPILFPELRSPWPAVGKRELWEHPFQACAIACHRCRLRLRSEPDNQNSIICHCYFKMDAPRALVFRPLVKRNEAPGTRLEKTYLEGL